MSDPSRTPMVEGSGLRGIRILGTPQKASMTAVKGSAEITSDDRTKSNAQERIMEQKVVSEPFNHKDCKIFESNELE